MSKEQERAELHRAIWQIAKGAASEEDLKGLFDDIDVNSNKLGATVAKRNELLVKIINAIGELQLGAFTDNTIDAFGDAYEFLMTMYASNAGKSGGEFYTPQEVAELLAEITVVGKKQVNKVYDPACGSGSLLLKFAKVLGKENVRQGFYGQEKNITTYNLCRINMFLHDINYEKFDFAVRIVNLYKYLCDEKKEFVLSKQILRSGTSVGAMVREAEHSESKADFVHKMAIAQKEINETIYWLELLCEMEYISNKEFESINKDAVKLIKMLTSSIKTAKSKLTTNR